jgi:DNA-binding MarR family transcriptional regulator
MTDQLTELQMRAWRAFLTAHANVIGQLTHELRADQDLALTWYDVLIQLSEAGGRLRMHELAERLVISRSATTRFVDRLERNGLIRREACPTDRRGLFVVLTEEGRDRLRRAAPGHLDGVKRHFADHLDDAELEVLAASLERIAEKAAGGH